MSQNTLLAVLHIGSLILAFIGLYFVVRVWSKWNTIDMEVLKAKVFLNKKFLERNWLYVFIAGAVLTIHQATELLISINLVKEGGVIDQISEILEFTALVSLIILAYEWFKVLYRVK